MSRSSRRGVLRGIATLSAAGALPASALTNPDAEVIGLAQRVVDAEAACIAAYSIPTLTAEEERALDPVRGGLIRDTAEKAEALAVLPVVTLAGALAKARAALAVADRDPADGEIIVKDYVDWLAYAALEDLTRVLEKQA